MWRRIGNQWIMGFRGAVALNYGPLFHELDRAGLDHDDYEDLFQGIKVVEAEVLAIFAEYAEEQQRRSQSRKN